jgi:hypothetical protein
MLLYLNTDVRISQFLMPERTQDNWVFRNEHSAELLLYLKFYTDKNSHLVVTMALSQE